MENEEISPEQLDRNAMAERKLLELTNKQARLEKESGKAIAMFTFSEKDEKGNFTGRVFGGFFKQPHILTKARVMDMLLSKQVFEAGIFMWTESFMENESDPEIDSDDQMKMAILPKLSSIIQIKPVDIKKN